MTVSIYSQSLSHTLTYLIYSLLSICLLYSIYSQQSINDPMWSIVNKIIQSFIYLYNQSQLQT